MNVVRSCNPRAARSRVRPMHVHPGETCPPDLLCGSRQRNVPLTFPAWVLFLCVPFTYCVLTRNPKTAVSHSSRAGLGSAGPSMLGCSCGQCGLVLWPREGGVGSTSQAAQCVWLVPESRQPGANSPVLSELSHIPRQHLSREKSSVSRN